MRWKNITICAQAVIVLLLALSCKKEKVEQDLLGWVSASSSSVTEVFTSNVDETKELKLSVTKGGIQDLTTTITFKVAPEAVDSINKSGGKTYKLLPESCYSFSTAQVTLAEGQKSGAGILSYNPHKIAELSEAEYILPVSFTSSSLAINPDQSKIIYAFTVNKPGADVWTEIFRDDFATLNTSQWSVTNRKDYNSPYTTYNASGVSIGAYDGTNCLVLTASKPGAANAYTSGHIKSIATFKPPVNRKYWIRASIKLIALDGATYKSFKQTNGVWPAFWTTNETNWPVNGEIDIMEGYSFGGTEKYSSNVFYGTTAGVNQLGTSCERAYGSGDGWHTYDLFWINNNNVMTLVVQLDGATVATYTNASNSNLQLQNFSAHNIIFDLCVGGSMFNNNNLNVMSKTMMWVDWVSVSSSPL